MKNSDLALSIPSLSESYFNFDPSIGPPSVRCSKDAQCSSMRARLCGEAETRSPEPPAANKGLREILTCWAMGLFCAQIASFSGAQQAASAKIKNAKIYVLGERNVQDPQRN